MKKILLAIAIILVSGLALIAQPPHPNEGSVPGTGNTPVGGGAPIDGGMALLITLATAYAFKKSADTTGKIHKK